jgi:DNA invertase Pin-like site-specific DNA recombinase
MPEKPKRAIAYYRSWTDRPEDSLEAQRARVCAWAARHGYQILREYADYGEPVGPALARMEDEAPHDEKGNEIVVLCDSADRLGRFPAGHLELHVWGFPVKVVESVPLESPTDGPHLTGGPGKE